MLPPNHVNLLLNCLIILTQHSARLDVKLFNLDHVHGADEYPLITDSNQILVCMWMQLDDCYIKNTECNRILQFHTHIIHAFLSSMLPS